MAAAPVVVDASSLDSYRKALKHILDSMRIQKAVLVMKSTVTTVTNVHVIRP